MSKKTNLNEGRQEDKNIDPRLVSDSLGIDGDSSLEYVGTYYKLKNEKVIEGKNDASIVLGRDRPNGPSSGYGGQGASRAAAIDIVVGRTSNKFSKQNKETLQSGVWLNPDFDRDAARIHISQKTDIDDNFEIPETFYKKAIGNSGIGIKADNVRIVSRETIKLVSYARRTDSSDLSIPAGGIELIAMDDSYQFEDYAKSTDPPIMQPMAKGLNLRDALKDILVTIDKLSGVFLEYVKNQTELNMYFGGHTHLETFYGNQGIPSIDIPAPLFNNMKQVLSDVVEGVADLSAKHLNSVESNYINELGPKYINSKHHYLN